MFEKNRNLFDFAVGGIYSICCLKNNKIYIGSSASLLERAGRHGSMLKTKIHECPPLQQDFNIYGSSSFEFRILRLENDLKIRFQLEKQFLSEQTPDTCYNSSFSVGFEKTKSVIAQQIIMDGKKYPSIREAEKVAGIPKTTIIRRLNDTKDSACIRLDKVVMPRRGKYDFIIDGIRYSSTLKVIAKDLAINDNQVRERCRSTSLKWKDWQMVQKNRSNDYLDKE